MKKRVPTYIITGFLGSGKTTLLQRLLTYCKDNGLKAAIVLNEIGETNVEQHLFADEQMLEMLNGCICCSIQGDFTKELHSFLRPLSEEDIPDLLFIEGTGIANPIEIVDALMDPLLIDDIELYSIINLIDGSKYLEYQSIFSSSKEVRNILKSQVSTSSFIIFNKIDLMDEKATGKVRKKIIDLKKSAAPIFETTYGDVDIPPILEKRITTWRKEQLRVGECGCTSEHQCTEHKNDHNHTFQAVKIEVRKPVDRLRLEKWLKELPETFIRGKGIIQLTETIGSFQFQFSSKQLKLSRMNEAPSVNPCIILIGIHINRDEIESSFYESVEK